MAASEYRVTSKEIENQIFRDNWIFRDMRLQTIHIDKKVEL